MKTTNTLFQSRLPLDMEAIITEIRQSLEIIDENIDSSFSQARLFYLQILAIKNQITYLQSQCGDTDSCRQLDEFDRKRLYLCERIDSDFPHIRTTLFTKDSPLIDIPDELEVWLEQVQLLAAKRLYFSESWKPDETMLELCRDILQQYHTIVWALQDDKQNPVADSQDVILWRQRITFFEQKLSLNSFYFEGLEEDPVLRSLVFPPGHDLFYGESEESAGYLVGKLLTAVDQLSAEFNTESCPKPETIRLYAIGGLSKANELDEIKSHCLNCTSCLDKVVNERLAQRLEHVQSEPDVSVPAFSAWLDTIHCSGHYIHFSPEALPADTPLSHLLKRLPEPLFAKDDEKSYLPVQVLLLWQRNGGITAFAVLSADIHYCRHENQVITVSGSCRQEDMRHLPEHATITCTLVDTEGNEYRAEEQHPSPGSFFSGLFSCRFTEPPPTVSKILVAIWADF